MTTAIPTSFDALPTSKRRFIGREVDRHDPQGWFGRLTLPVRRQITDCEVYEYVEIMP